MTQPAFFSLAVKEKKIIVRNKQDDFGLLFYFFVSLRSAWWSASDDRGHVSHHTVKCWMFGRVTLLLVHYKVSAICIFLTEWINTSNANLWTFLKLLVIKCFYICLHVYVCYAADFASSWPTGVGETRRQKRKRKKHILLILQHTKDAKYLIVIFVRATSIFIPLHCNPCNPPNRHENRRQ